MLQTQTCVSVRCDECGDGPYSPELEPHWPTEDAALDAAAVAGWHVEDRDLPRLLCPDCGTALSCEDRGHEFTQWRRCRCEQLVPAHRAGPDGLCGMAFRYCLRCCLQESHPDPAGDAAGGLQVPAEAIASMCSALRDLATELDPTAATRAAGASEVLRTDTGLGSLTGRGADR